MAGSRLPDPSDPCSCYGHSCKGDQDIFTCAVASLANVGGTATAPVLAGAYSSALVPVGILMALLGNIIGTPGGAFVGHLMSLIG